MLIIYIYLFIIYNVLIIKELWSKIFLNFFIHIINSLNMMDNLTNILNKYVI